MSVVELRTRHPAPLETPAPRTGKRVGLYRITEFAAGIQPACFRSEERMACQQYACTCRAECLRLVAEWKR